MMDLSYNSKVDKLLLRYLNNKTYTGCALGFSRLKNKEFKRDLIFKGKKEADKNGISVNKDTFFDVASLTKPMVTVLCLLSLFKEGKVSINDSIGKLLPNQYISQDKKKITLKKLISHTSGFPPHRPFYNKIKSENIINNKEILVNLILSEGLESFPGEKYIYSDLDYMLLGHIIEKYSGMNLGEYWKKKITEPLNISDNFYLYGCLDKKTKSKFAGTGICPWSGLKLEGEVHDDNCRAIGVLSGHAGLFSNLDGVLDICEFILKTYKDKKSKSAIDGDMLKYFLKKRDKEHWAYGFDVVSLKKSSSGEFFSENSIGHLGYTGTSFWIDLKRNIIIVLLTNRVIYGADPSKIKEMRPKIHNALMEYLVKEV